MNERMFKFAREESLRSDYTGSGSSPSLGCVAFYKGTIIGRAHNTNKTSPLQSRYNIYRYNRPELPSKNHAETALLSSIRWKFGDSLDWSRVDIYIYRELKNGTLANSRPCNSCFHMLKDFGVRRVFYTTENGYCEEILK